jgi:hypothetical protein
MARYTDEVARKTKATAQKAYEKLETRILIAEGRKSLQRKAAVVSKVGRKALKAGAISAAVAAAAVVVREVRKRRALG